MKWLIVFCALLLIGTRSFAAGPVPVIFYSDLTSGPKNGGAGGLGVFVTIRGSGFGAQRGQSTVTLGGGSARRYVIWTDTTIVFQPGRDCRSGFIQVHTASGDSNGIGFQIRRGRIFFVDASAGRGAGRGTISDPWSSPARFYRLMRPGDTCYFREGVYSGRYGNQSSPVNMAFGQDSPDGSSGNEIAWVAYPGEKARFVARSEEAAGCFEFRVPRDHYVIAGFSLAASGRPCVSAGGRYHRIINNDCEGNTDFSYALVFLNRCSFGDVLGNNLHGMASGNKLSHPVYIGGAGSNITVAWNRISGNRVAEGPLVCVNQDNARGQQARFTEIGVHDNFIDGTCGDQISRGIGFVGQAEGSTAAVYNNIIVNCSSALYVLSGSVDFLNNTIAGCSGPVAAHIYSAYGYYPENVRVMNNIISVEPGCRYIDSGAVSGAVAAFNNYWGNGKGPADDPHAVNADPAFAGEDRADFSLSGGSPAIDAGSGDAASVVSRDFNGLSRPQGKAFDLGALEYAGTSGTKEPAGLLQ